MATKDVKNKKNGEVAEPETKATQTEETVEAKEKPKRKRASTKKKEEKTAPAETVETEKVEKVEATVVETPIDEDDVDIDEAKITSALKESEEESLILNMSDKTLQDYINNAVGYEDYEENVDAEDFDDETEVDSADFFASSSNKKEIDDAEILNSLRTLGQQKNILMAQVIGTKRKYMRSQNSAVNVMCAECKFINKPFDKFTVFIPFDYFYAESEKNFMRKMVASISQGRKRAENPEIDRKLAEYEEMGNKIKALEVVQGSYLHNYLFAHVPVIVLGIDSNKTIIGSRAEALKKREKAFFNKGRYINGVKKIPEKGSIVYNCNITLVEDNFVRVDICGIPTNIRLEETSWPFISSCKEKFKVGEQVDVKILAVTGINETGRRHLKASIKRAEPMNTTLDALNEARRDLSQSGKFKFLCDTTGTVKRVKKNPEHFGYFIQTDKGYNAIALHHKFNSDATKNLRTFSEDKIPLIGSKIVFHPVIISRDLALGTIADVIIQ